MRPLLLPLVALQLISSASAQLSDADLNTVAARLAQAAQQSWELGARAQAILSLNATDYSVYTASPYPPPQNVPSNITSAIAPVFSIARNVVSALGLRTNGSSNATSLELVAGDGAAGDPPSIGVAVLLANWTGRNSDDGLDYAKAAENQLDFLLNETPHTSDGAISHRVAQVQLWSDNVYMVPPFLALYGVHTSNKSLMGEAYNQVKLYRQYLRDDDADGLWKHIVLSTNADDGGVDEGHWSTGNGWAAAGMLRVLATMKHSSFSDDFKNEQNDLASWVKEIHSAVFNNIDDTNIFTNYADKSIKSSGSFYDAASTALIAATVYRFALLRDDHTHLPNAEKCRKALFATKGAVSASTTASAPASSGTASAARLGDLEHFTSDGWLTPVVDPHQVGVEGKESAEGNAFVLELQAAYREWVAAGSPGINAASRAAATSSITALALLLGISLLF
ncbi:hypothetical protein MKEN_01203700 [Mycena kentingensis (nom. inval.)]|nr:hypothetical protein MKEN_01203700 [Mycena kentingensis (nom. inval.)]